MRFDVHETDTMRTSSASSRPLCQLTPRRTAVPAIAVSAFIAAWVLVASESAIGEETSALQHRQGAELVAQSGRFAADSTMVKLAQQDHPGCPAPAASA